MGETLPKCFGDTDLYDPKNAECAGGYDPSFYEEGSHVRPKCATFEACGSHCRAKNAINRVGGAAALTTPSRSVTVLQSNKKGQPQHIAVSQPTFVTAEQLQAQPAPILVANQMMPVNYGMPSYLSVLEPERKKKGKKWKSLTSEVGRSIGKSVGHSIAHFFDSVPWLGNDD